MILKTADTVLLTLHSFYKGSCCFLEKVLQTGKKFSPDKNASLPRKGKKDQTSDYLAPSSWKRRQPRPGRAPEGCHYSADHVWSVICNISCFPLPEV